MSLAFWANVLVVIHAAYVSFVIVGLLLIVVGLLSGWRWVRNPWFRSLHLLAIAIVAYEAVYNIECPLTGWERQLREAAGQPVEEASFVGRIVHELLFFEDADEALLRKFHMGFGGLVLLTFLLGPPRFRRLKAVSSRSDPGSAPAAAARRPPREPLPLRCGLG